MGLGGGLNNIMWTPPDCDLIEFNEFPDDLIYTQSHGKTPVRRVYISAFWAKTVTGKYFNVEASIKHPVDFYRGKMRISPRELLDVMKMAGNGTIMKPGFTYDELPEEEHTVWELSEQVANVKKIKAIITEKKKKEGISETVRYRGKSKRRAQRNVTISHETRL